MWPTRLSTQFKVQQWTVHNKGLHIRSKHTFHYSEWKRSCSKYKFWYFSQVHISFQFETVCIVAEWQNMEIKFESHFKACEIILVSNAKIQRNWLKSLKVLEMDIWTRTSNIYKLIEKWFYHWKCSNEINSHGIFLLSISSAALRCNESALIFTWLIY